MKTPKFLLVAAMGGVVVFGGMAPVMAGPRAGARQGAGERRMEGLLAQLNLSDAQKTQIKGILQDAQSKALALRKDTSLTPDQKKAQMEVLHKDARKAVMADLTADQRAKLKELLKQARQNRQAQK